MINIIGIGATGSKVALSLLKANVPIRVFDFDKVENNNMQNQVYTLQHIGKPKVEAMQDIAKSLGKERKIKTFNVKVTKDNAQRYLRGTVLLLVDSIEVRRELFCNLPSDVNWLIDTRIGTSDIYIYSIDCQNPIHRDLYTQTLHVVAESATTLCESRIEVNSTSDVCSGLVQELLWEGKFRGEVYFNTVDLIAFKNRYE